MTYNFDPDRWYEDEKRRLDLKRRAGALDDPAYARALEELERRYDRLLSRLDGTYQLPRTGGPA